jgi:peptidyl-prolyl cis-trans isomerase B (cyclophilin B)
MSNPVVTITMENGGVVTAELYPKAAPNTVRNFISLVKKGYYDGLIFHRVISGFMIQGGCPQGRGTGGPGYAIRGEFRSNRFDNPIKHTRGVLSMARAADPDSAGSQFFIMQEDSPPSAVSPPAWTWWTPSQTRKRIGTTVPSRRR